MAVFSSCLSCRIVRATDGAPEAYREVFTAVRQDRHDENTAHHGRQSATIRREAGSSRRPEAAADPDMDITDILDPLNEAQREAVTVGAEPTLVLAGAGSG